jgi:2-C-methyl-D-erythritol 2,4-cyclodiphosphate synthase
MRVGWGFDAHQFADTGVVLVAGITADDSRGVEATSDGDVAVHALIDALLGAAVLGDIGTLYPSSDSRWAGADSMRLLADTVDRLMAAEHTIASVDVTVISQSVRIAPVRAQAREALATVLGIPVEFVSLKATTTDSMGSIGRDEGIAATAVAVVE